MAVKEAYGKLQKAHNLPSWEELSRYFSLDDLESGDVLSGICKEMTGLIQQAIDFLDPILQPDTNVCDMYESRYIEDSDKKEAFSIFKRLLYWKRSSFIASVKNDNVSHADFIKRFLKEWEELRASLVDFAGKVRDSWESDLEQPEELGYFG